MMEIFKVNRPFLARVDLEHKNLPLSLGIYTKSSLDQKEFDKRIPEDLQIYLSLNCKEPSLKNCDLAVRQPQVARMNEKDKRTIVFGKKKDLETSVFRDRVYISFECFLKPVVLYLRVGLAKSDEQVADEKKEALLLNKQRMLAQKKNIKLDELSPRSILEIMEEVDEDLKHFYKGELEKQETKTAQLRILRQQYSF